MFIYIQPRRSAKINPEHNLRSQEQPLSPIITLENNRGHFINLHNIMTVNNIGRIEMHKTFLFKIHMIVKINIMMVTFIVEYQHPPENMFPLSLINPHRNITCKMDLFLLEVQQQETARLIITHIHLSSHLWNMSMYCLNINIFCPRFLLKLIQKSNWWNTIKRILG